MKCTIPEISWHNRDPVLSIDIQPKQTNSEDFWRLASGGTDSHVLIWRVRMKESGAVDLEFVSDLTRHQKAVNVVRFSPSGEFLASGDDESVILIWKQKADHDTPELSMHDDEEKLKEQWTSFKVLRGHVEDVYDLSWSPDNAHLISGSVDNSAIFWDLHKGRSTAILREHKGFVQGVAWDPLNKYAATLCSDRVCRIYSVKTNRIAQRIFKACLPGIGGSSSQNSKEKVFRLYHDDTLKSFFRRPCFTPDGELLITPAGIIEQEGDKKDINVTYIFSRHMLNRPAVYLPSGDDYTVAVKCCPVLFELRCGKTNNNITKKEEDPENISKSKENEEDAMEVDGVDNAPPMQSNSKCETPNKKVPSKGDKPWEKYNSLFALPYRVVFAVATQNSVLLYDTQQVYPFARISNIHYTRLTDVTWSLDGKILMVSSTDGYCSVITFGDGELGVPYTPKEEETELEINKEEAMVENINGEKSVSVNVSPKQEEKDEEEKVPVKAKRKSTPKQLPKSTPKQLPKSASKQTPKSSMNISKFFQPVKGDKKVSPKLSSPSNAASGREDESKDEMEAVEYNCSGCFQRGIALRCNIDCKVRSSSTSVSYLSDNPNSIEDVEMKDESSLVNDFEKANIKSPASNVENKEVTSPPVDLQKTPSKNENADRQLGTPNSKGSVPPFQEMKKTPRRVQLITLSSPKNKKRPL